MYNLPYFKTDDHQEVIDFIKKHPFAFLTGSANNLPVATQVPLLVDQEDDQLLLCGHIMKHTDHHKAFLQNPNVLCVFTGAHAYVSASWYTNPLSGSTWNYMSVQARGQLRFVEEVELREILRRTTSHFENNPASPSLYEHLTEEYISKLIKAIVGIEIRVTALDHVFKLSQNRDKESYENIIKHLSDKDPDAQKIASIMEQKSSNLFPSE